MARSEAKVAVAQVGYRRLNDTQSARPTISIAGFPLSVWGFALRTWATMTMALYAAFWLQLESGWSAAVTVSILSLQTRGQTYQRAVYWVLAAIIGIVESLVIGGLFPQNRDLFMIGFAIWLGLCIYAGALLDGNRAYGAILCGYTVAQVDVTQIDSPQNIFSAGINRGAAIVVGIAACPRQRRVRRPERASGPDRQALSRSSAGARLRARRPPRRECALDPLGEPAA